MSAGRRQIEVVLDGPQTPAWQARALAGLVDSDALEILGVRVLARRPRGRARRAHAAIERHLFALGPDAVAGVSIDRSAVVADAHAPPSAAELVVWLSERKLPPDEQREVLYLRHGGLREPVEDAFRRAALRGRPWVITEALLRRREESRLIARTVSGARRFSTTLSRDRALWKLADFVRRAVERAPGLDLQAPASERAARAPSTAELLARSPLSWARVVGARVLFRRLWRIRVRARAAEPTRDWGQARDLVQWRDGHVYADPFLFEHEGRHHLFCEEIAPASTRGVISHTELLADGSVAPAPTPVLSASYHLSYPFVFAYGGELFMIPETSSQRRVELYRAVDFPHEWRREAILLDQLGASDATVFEHDGRWWMFVGVAVAHATMLDELHLFSAATPLGPWRAHPRNPVVSDVRCGRPAGAIQRWGSKLVRPAQDGSRRYGGAVSFRQIDVLSAGDYTEHEIARLDPADLGDARATHSYACDGRFEAVDLRRRERVGARDLIRLTRRLARRLRPRRAASRPSDQPGAPPP